MRVAPLAVSLLLAAVVLPPVDAGGGVDWTTQAADCGPGQSVTHRRFVERPGIEVAVDALCDVAGEPTVVPSDCARTTFGLTGWAWREPVGFKVDASSAASLPASGVLAAFAAATLTWDDATSTQLSTPPTLGGKARDAGRYNGVDQIGWKRLQAGTIAVTTTWYYTSTGEAVESDAAYNTRYAWTLGGSSRSYDVQEIATHEIGHTWGLDDLYDAADACLTMYGYGAYGATHARTLGDGDHLGIHAIYGP